MPVQVVAFNVIVVVFPVLRPRVVWWVDIDGIHLAPVRIGQRFQDVVVLSINYRVEWLIASLLYLDAVFAYIECKHSISSDAVLEKAIGQAEAVKKLVLTRRALDNPDYEVDGPVYNGRLRDWPRTFPPLKNQPFCAVFARKYSPDVTVPRTHGEHTPDLLILGNNYIATQSVNLGPDGIKSSLFFDTKYGAGLCAEQSPENAYGLGLVTLLEALSWIELLPIDWTGTLNATFFENLRKVRTSTQS